MPDRGRDHVCVVEVLNNYLRELYIFTTDLPLDEISAKHKQMLPAAISHWRANHLISYCCLEESIPQADTQTFISAYSRSMSGYKVITETNQFV